MLSIDDFERLRRLALVEEISQGKAAKQLAVARKSAMRGSIKIDKHPQSSVTPVFGDNYFSPRPGILIVAIHSSPREIDEYIQCWPKRRKNSR